MTVERLGDENIESTNKALAVFPLYHYIYKKQKTKNKKHKTLVPLINQEILRLKESGELQELIRIAEDKVISLNTR